MNEKNIKIVEDFFDALRRKDLSKAPIADDLKFEEPMMGAGSGSGALKAFVDGFYAALSDIRIIQHISDGDYVVTHWEVDGVFGTIPILEKFHILNGKIVEFHAFYDPRPVLG
jgi:hypothetical protein